MSRCSIFLLASSLLLTISLQSSSTHAFTSNFQQRQGVVAASLSSTQDLQRAVSKTSRTTLIFSTPPENESGGDPLDAFGDPLQSNKPPASTSTPEDKNYPIDLPSPILLGSSMILAIVGVGKNRISAVKICFSLLSWNRLFFF